MVKEIQRVQIAGCGTMGAQIALQFATHGFEVRLFNERQHSLDRAMASIGTSLDGLMANGHCTEMNEVVPGRIPLFTNAAAAADGVDLISESVPDGPVLKGEVFARFHPLCPAHTLFLSNTFPS